MNGHPRQWAEVLGALVALCGFASVSHADPSCSWTLPAATQEDFYVTDYQGLPQTYHFWGRHHICYASGETWLEPKTPTKAVKLIQRATIYTPSDPSAIDAPVRPLIIWTHPNGGTEEFGYDASNPNAASNPFAKTALLQSVLAPAMNAGYALISLEFRHPVASYIPDQAVPGNTDIRDAIQYIRANASALKIDANNIFLVGQSRGSLNTLWQMKGTTPDAGNTGWQAQPWNVNAIWNYQAQTCYDKKTVGNYFVRPGADRAAFDTDPINPDVPDTYQTGCAFDDARLATTGLPPIRLMHDEAATGDLQAYCASNVSDYDCWLRYHDAAGLWNIYFDRHDANFGVALSRAYGLSGNASKISTCTGVAVFYNDPSGPYNGYAGYTRFFDLHQNPPKPSGVNPPCPDVAHAVSY